jgi:hypothetical protein
MSKIFGMYSVAAVHTSMVRIIASEMILIGFFSVFLQTNLRKVKDPMPLT